MLFADEKGVFERNIPEELREAWCTIEKHLPTMNLEQKAALVALINNIPLEKQIVEFRR